MPIANKYGILAIHKPYHPNHINVMYTKNTHIHFVGIGGIGMSGIATILKKSGYAVSGCDPDTTQETITQLRNIGCIVHHGNNTPACADESIDILVYIPMYEYTIPAITNEISRARERNIITVTRAQMLSELMRTKYSIATSGSHGKTTTSALIAHILLHADYDPTIVIGGQLKNIQSNAYVGSGEFFVAEADESDRSFLQLNPTLAVVTNIDLEHLETYKDLDDIKQAFAQFMTNLPFYGKAIVCIDDKNIQSLLPLHKTSTLTYGIHNSADIFATNIVLNKDHSLFDVHTKQKPEQSLGTIMLPIAGIHNVYNALGAITLALEIGIDFDTISQGLALFGGVDRRFSFHGMYKGAEIFDDYGHHPKEIENTLLVARKRTKNKLIVVFQPHRYTRTHMLWNDFLSTLSTNIIDTLIITDIYPAGEKAIENISSKQLTEELLARNPLLTIHYAPISDNFSHIKTKIAQSTQPDDLILLLGAGRMHYIAEQLINSHCP